MIHVVIVEDEEILRKGLVCTVDWLSMDAVVVADCENGKQGLAAIQQYKPDIVFTDIKMPVMDGLSMLEEARRQGLEFISVLLTSYSEFEYAHKAISLGVFDYLLKPVDDEKLADVMKRATGRIEENRQHQQAAELVSAGAGENVITLVNLKTDNPYIKYTFEQVEKRWKEHMSLETLADELHVSTSYLSRVFKSETGGTFLEFINKYRVQKAVELLSTKQYRVYEVADMTGFSDYKQFHRIFREYTSISPTEFLKGAGAIMKAK